MAGLGQCPQPSAVWRSSCAPCLVFATAALACDHARLSMIQWTADAELHSLLAMDAAPCSMSACKCVQAPDHGHGPRLHDSLGVRREAALQVRLRHPRRSRPAHPALLASSRCFDTMLSSCNVALRGRMVRVQVAIRGCSDRFDASDALRNALHCSGLDHCTGLQCVQWCNSGANVSRCDAVALCTMDDGIISASGPSTLEQYRRAMEPLERKGRVECNGSHRDAKNG